MLSGSIGFGHDQLAEACATTLEAESWTTRQLDLMRLLGRGADSIADSVFRSMLAVPGVFDAFHFSALRDGNRLADLADTAATRRIIPRLRNGWGHPEVHGIRGRRGKRGLFLCLFRVSSFKWGYSPH